MNLMIKYRSLSQLKKNVFSGSILAGSSIIILFVSYPIYLHFLGTELYGLWATLSVVLAFSRLGNLGINNAIIKYSAEEYGQNNLRGITEYLTTSLYILSVPSVIILSFLFFFKNTIIGFLNLKGSFINEMVVLVPCIGILSVLILFGDLIKGVLMGLGRVDISNYILLIGRIVQIGLSVFYLYSGMGIWGLYYGAFIMYTLVVCVYIIILLFKFKIKIFCFVRYREKKTKKLISFGGPLFFARVISMLLVPFNKVIIAKYIGLSEVTYYDIALKGAFKLRSIFEMGVRAIMPKVSEIKAKYENSKEQIRSIHQKGIKFLLKYALPMFLLLIIFNKPLLKLWLGHNFNEEIVFGLRILLLSFLINLLCLPAFYIFMGIGRVQECFRNLAIQSLLNVGIIAVYILFNIRVKLPVIYIINGLSFIIAACYIHFKYYIWENKDIV